MLKNCLISLVMAVVFGPLNGCGNTKSRNGQDDDTESSTYTDAEERAKAAFDASCRHGCQMNAKCRPDDFGYVNLEDCYEDLECGVSDTDSEEICEDEHTPDAYWNATAALEECEVNKMNTCDVWFIPMDASDEEHDAYYDNVYPCKAESEYEDVAEEAWFNTPEGQSMAEDCWGEM